MPWTAQLGGLFFGMTTTANGGRLAMTVAGVPGA